MKYAEILNSGIVNIHNSLPLNYNNISNFFALDIEELNDLSWSGNSGVKFYEYIPDDIPPDTILESTSYTIDDENKKVYGKHITKPIPIPTTITATQIRLWLINHDISLASVEEAINNIEDPKTKEITLVQWEYAPYVERNHPLIETIGSVLGMTREQIDDAFLEASLIT